MRFLLFFICVFLPGILRAQDVEYARQVVQTLASDSMKGRGYIDDGDKLVSTFLKQEFEQLGLEAIDGSWFQPFNMAVNTFPGLLMLQIGDSVLVPGQDFLVSPSAPSASGTFETIHLSAQDIFTDHVLEQKIREGIGKVFVIEPIDVSALNEAQKERWLQFSGYLRFHPNNVARATILLTRQKLTWSGARQQLGRPFFEVNSNSVPANFTQVSFTVEAELIENYPTQNVIAKIDGTESDSLIVFMAHYDHFGKMGSALFPGANDNASGVAMMMSLARYFSTHPPKYTTVFLAFGGEEIGLLGSKYFIEHPTFDLEKIKFYLNFDLAGTGDEGIQVVNGSVYRSQFNRMRELNAADDLLPDVKIRGAACNSDHCVFHEKNIPGFYIYTLGGIRAYHDIYDRAETLPFTEFEDYFELVVKFIEDF